MKRTYHIGMRAIILLMLSIGSVLLALNPQVAVAQTGRAVGPTMCACPGAHKPLGNNATCEDACYGVRSAPGGGGPGIDYGAIEARRRAQEAEAERQRQAEADRIDRERWAEEKRQKDAAFIRDRDAAAGSLKGSSGGAMNQLKGLAGTDNSGLKGSGFDTGSSGLKELRGSDRTDQKARAQPAPHTDTSVVDARNVASGLPKSLDNAVATAYANAPPGVSDRVRKGFQAVMVRDWKVAKAWFQDALNRDPSNAGLKRLVALSDSPQQPGKQPATVDARNEPAGLGGRSNAKGAGAPLKKTKPAPASTTGAQVQLPDPNDIYLMFPGLKAIEDKQALDYLFGLDPYPPSPKTGKPK